MTNCFFFWSRVGAGALQINFHERSIIFSLLRKSSERGRSGTPPFRFPAPKKKNWYQHSTLGQLGHGSFFFLIFSERWTQKILSLEDLKHNAAVPWVVLIKHSELKLIIKKKSLLVSVFF